MMRFDHQFHLLLPHQKIGIIELFSNGFGNAEEEENELFEEDIVDCTRL